MGERSRRKLVEAETEPEVGINDSQLAARQRRPKMWGYGGYQKLGRAPENPRERRQNGIKKIPGRHRHFRSAHQPTPLSISKEKG